ncbi:MOSC domain-containing protein [Kineosporia sp. NBRC 101731]|uniref:MOSC domain-containing protein n=1 Tax=Kineosporia sp. NBRC 101731 TaxID=3032199 RepID=UPI0024A50066|nr:MOSC domain-containing protein [Kineosporia sp. NBRC 101731]GLY33827.1 molybdenum cofactor sulfurase [Kineosporia sp. NBRC 101731]
MGIKRDGPGTSVGRVVSLWHYPVKGLSAQPLSEVELTPGAGFPADRIWALARPGGDYHPGRRTPVSKHQFFVLVKEERLAGLNTHLDADSENFTVSVREHVVLQENWTTPQGRERSMAFFARVLDLPAGVLPVLAREDGRRFTDVSVVSDALMNAVSIINLASVRDLEQRTGLSIDPLRLRANIYVDGLPAWSELGLVGSDITIGQARLHGVRTTHRCAATEVNPADARRDIPLPRLLVQHIGTDEIGVYGEVIDGGAVKIEDEVVW